MNEHIEINFTRNGKRWPVRRQLEDGRIEFDEPDPIPRRVWVSLTPRDEVTSTRMRWVRQRLGWPGNDFLLSLRAEGGALVLRGIRENDSDTASNLPHGFYRLQVLVEEALVVKQAARFRLRCDGHHEANVELRTDDRQVAVHLDQCDEKILAVLGASEIDGESGIDWLARKDRRPSRKACILNLLASLRSRPSPRADAHLLAHVIGFYMAANDRCYAQVHTELLRELESLVDKKQFPSRPFYREGRPTARIHECLVYSVPPDEAEWFSIERLTSFRGENSPSLQAVIAAPDSGVHAYAEFDLDLGNALQDLWGLIVHVGELLDGKQTNHLDLYKKLKKTPAGPFLCYSVVP